MTQKDKTSDAVQILRNRYVKDDPDRTASVETERVNAQVARMIYDLRNDAGLTGIPERRMLVLAGAVKDTPPTFSERASRFVAQSESFAKLTKEEQMALDDFVQFLKEDE